MIKTSIKLSDPKEKFYYKQIKDKIAEHFLAQFFLLLEEDYNLQIDIKHNFLKDNDMYEEVESINIKEFQYKDQQIFKLFDYGNEETFKLYHVFRNDNNTKKQHGMLLCAGLREAKVKKFDSFPDDFIYTEDKLEKFSSYLAVICSDFLDKKVLLDRTGLSLKSIKDHYNEEDEYYSESEKNFTPITDEMIFSEVKKISIEYLEKNKYTIKWDKDKEEKINKFKEEHIYLNPLLKDVNISWSDKDDDIYRKVNQKKIEKEEQVKKSINKLIRTLEQNDTEDFISSKEFTKAIKEATNLNSIELSVYVYYRKYALQLLESILSYKDKNKQEYFKEDKIHNFLYPQRKNSENTDYESHNLWVIDDRWAFYEYITSETELCKINKDSQSKQRPDIVIFSSLEQHISSILLIELKRPNESHKGNNPHKQLKSYIYDINSSKSIITSTGRTLKLADKVKYYGYIICNTNDKFILKEVINEYSYKRDYDGSFYLHNIDDGQTPETTIQILDFELLLENAKNRNKAFIDKLPI